MRQQTARLGDLPLRSGQVVRDCCVGYRTFGALDAARSNAVLVLPWFLGRSAELSRHIGPRRLVDSSRYFVVAVDPIGAGVSSSPSNSALQPGSEFPRYAVRDLVEAQHRLLTRVLGIVHLRAVVGTSFGGMQVFEWATAHPSFMEKAVTIAGSPRLPADERRRWLEHAGAVQAERPLARAARAADALRRGHPLEAFRALRDDPLDHARQAEAVASTDVSADFGGSLEQAAAAVRATILVVVSPGDRTVRPGPAIEFCQLAGARLLLLNERYGHDAPARQKATLWPAVDRFIAE